MREALVRLDETDFAALGIEELVDLGRSADIRELDELACRGDGSVSRLAVDERMDETALDDLEYVKSWELVSSTDGAFVYVVSFVAPGLSEDVADAAEELVGTCDPAVDNGGATVSLVGPQAAIADTVGEYEADGASPELRRLGGYDGGERPLAELTDRQREVVETAYGAGYYEVPREATAAEVASELGLDASTVVEHLQRVERNLMSHHLEGA